MQESKDAQTPWMAIGETAAALGVSVDTMRRWDKAGYIVAQRTPSGHRRYHRDDVAKLISRRQSTTDSRSAS